MGVKWVLVMLSLTIVKGHFVPANLLHLKNIPALTDINISSVNLLQHEHKSMSFLDLLRYENVTVADTNTICTYFRTVTNVSDTCGEQLEIACENETLLMTLIDASSKFPYPGLSYSTRMDYGNFDQCLAIDHTYSEGRILGEYCTVGLAIPDIFGNLSDPDSYYKLSLCRPDGCVADDYNAILENLTSQNLGLFVDIFCVTVETYTELEAGDIATLSVFLIVIILMTLSTVYDICLYFNESKSYHPLLLSFSVLSNGRKLLHISRHTKSREQIEPFHGIRVISMMWIVAGHGLVMWAYLPVTNAERIITWQKEMYSVYIAAGPLAVDTFFYMSGFLLGFQYFKGKTKSLAYQLISIPQMYIHRYLRLTPAMVMVYLVTITLFIRIGSGPLWTTMAQSSIDVCEKHWWQFLLYIQNYYDAEDICLIQTWYVSADMQLFLLSPLLLIPLSLHLKKYGLKVVMVELLVWNVFWTFLPMTTKLVFRDHHYDFDTHSRVINYSIGIMLGVFMRVTIEEPFLYMINKRNRPAVNLLTWSVIILGMLATVICYQDENLHHGYNSKSVFEALMRPAWCIGLSWITYSCYHGQGGFVNWILCRPIFQVLGRLTFCIYLTHMTVIWYYIGTVRTKWYFTDYGGFYQFCGHYIVSLIVATFWTLAFESPLIIIEKYLLGGCRRSKEPSIPQNGRNGEPMKAAA